MVEIPPCISPCTNPEYRGCGRKKVSYTLSPSPQNTHWARYVVHACGQLPPPSPPPHEEEQEARIPATLSHAPAIDPKPQLSPANDGNIRRGAGSDGAGGAERGQDKGDRREKKEEEGRKGSEVRGSGSGAGGSGWARLGREEEGRTRRNEARETWKRRERKKERSRKT